MLVFCLILGIRRKTNLCWLFWKPGTTNQEWPTSYIQLFCLQRKQTSSLCQGNVYIKPKISYAFIYIQVHISIHTVQGLFSVTFMMRICAFQTFPVILKHILQVFTKSMHFSLFLKFKVNCVFWWESTFMREMRTNYDQVIKQKH